MMKKEKSTMSAGLLAAAFIFLSVFCFPQAQESEKQQIINSEKRIPFFAVVGEEPIRSLDQKDLLFSVNNVAVPDFQLIKFEGKLPEKRLCILVLDSMFCSNYGVKRARDIAEILIKEAPPNDSLMVLLNSANEGLSCLAGPTTDREKLLKAVKKAKLFSGLQWFQDMFSRKDRDQAAERFSASSDYAVNEYLRPPDAERTGANFANQYMNQVTVFMQKLAQAQVGLQMVLMPKVMYYISEGYQEKDPSSQLGEDRTSGNLNVPAGGANLTTGASRSSIKTDTSTEIKEQTLSGVVSQYSKKMIETFKKSGNVLFAINPGKLKTEDSASSGSMNLEYLMGRKGSYFQGQDTAKIIAEVKRRTSDYYELVPGTALNASMMNAIEIKNTRDEAVLHGPWFWSRRPSYREMSNNDQRAYAVNLVTGGLISHLAGEAEMLSVKTKTAKASGGEIRVEVDAEIPSSWENKVADIYLIAFDKNLKRWGIEQNRKSLSRIEKLSSVIKDKKNTVLYMAIVDPETNSSLYNEIK